MVVNNDCKDEDDFTHYFNATGRLSRRVVALEEELAEVKRLVREFIFKIEEHSRFMNTILWCPDCSEMREKIKEAVKEE